MVKNSNFYSQKIDDILKFDEIIKIEQVWCDYTSEK